MKGGAQSDVGVLRSVVLKHARDAFVDQAAIDQQWRDLGYLGLEPSDLADFPELPRDEHGHLRLAELPLGRLVRDQVRSALAQHGIKTTMVVKDVGYELRCVAPNAFDQEYTRELGAGAVETLLAGTANVMITRQDQGIVALPFDEILDPKTGKTRVRMLDVAGASFTTALSLQTRLLPADLDQDGMAKQIAHASQLDADALRARFA